LIKETPWNYLSTIINEETAPVNLIGRLIGAASWFLGSLGIAGFTDV
jgi:hypothetical protein